MTLPSALWDDRSEGSWNAASMAAGPLKWTEMTEYSELATRLSRALDRIGTQLEQSGGATAGEDIAALKEALEAERATNAQFEERVAAIKDKQEKVVAKLEEEVARLSDEADEMARQLATMRDANAALRDNNSALREANAAGLGDAGLINAALAGELDALRAVQSADRAELDAIVAALKPMVEGEAHA